MWRRGNATTNCFSANEAEGKGFEPLNAFRLLRFSSPDTDCLKDKQLQEIRDNCRGEVPTVVPSIPTAPQISDLSPELSRIISVWASLPAIVKTGILAMVEASDGTRRDVAK